MRMGALRSQHATWRAARERLGVAPAPANVAHLPSPVAVVRENGAPLPGSAIAIGDSVTGSGPIGLDLAKLIEGRLLIQGNSGAGKSILLRRIFEESFGRIQLVVLDPDGEFSTLAEIFDLAVIAAAELLRIGGAALARQLREKRISAILDMYDMPSEARLAFAAEFNEAFLAAAPEHWHPVLLLVDEVQTLAPHYDAGDVTPDTRKRSTAALADIMGRGRKRGIAGVLATGRIAETSKAVIAKATNVIIGRTIFDRDLERAGALLGFTAGHAKALRTLTDGEFMAIGPAIAGPRRVRFRTALPRSRHKGKAPAIEAPPPAMSAGEAAQLLRSLPDSKTPPQMVGPQTSGRRAHEWTGQEDALIREAFCAGKTLREICGELGAQGHWQPSTATLGLRVAALGLSAARRRRREWTPGEDAIIRDGYAAGKTLREIADALAASGLDRPSMSALSQRGQALGVVSARAAARWTEEEDAIVVDAYARDVRIADIVDLLLGAGYQRHRNAIQMRAIALGLSTDRVNYWTEPEKAIAIAGLEAGKPHREILADLKTAGFHRGVTAIFKFAQKHNFNRAADPWTAEDIARLRALYEKPTPVKELSAILGKTEAAIRTKAHMLGLRQRTAWSDAERQILIDAQASGKTLVEAAALIGRPYVNVAGMARNLQLDFRRRKGADNSPSAQQGTPHDRTGGPEAGGADGNVQPPRPRPADGGSS